jgi:hypothetical protein
MININLDKAKEIHRNKIREARKPLLEAKDVEFQRALETGGDTSDIVAAKTALRDATAAPSIDLASNVEELKATWNQELLGASPYEVES